MYDSIRYNQTLKGRENVEKIKIEYELYSITNDCVLHNGTLKECKEIKKEIMDHNKEIGYKEKMRIDKVEYIITYQQKRGTN